MKSDNTPLDLNSLGLLVADHVTAMLGYWDKDLICRFANAAYREWFGNTREEMVGKMTIKQFLGPIYELNLPYILEALKGNPQSFEREVILPTGDVRHSIVSYTPHIVNGEVIGFFAHVANVTQIKLLEKELLRSNQIIVEQNNRLLNFAHITSHNLRSPVSNLNSLLHFYKQSEGQEDKKVIFNKFEVVINHLTSTLNELIETLKIQEDDSKVCESLVFEEVFYKTKETMAGHIMETHAIVTFDFSRAKTIEYPKTYLESIMLNLLSNAIRYKSPHRTPKIHFQTDNINGQLSLTVSDNGLGMDMDKHGNKLFGLNKTFHEHPEAKGVGLFITKTQIEAMGGEIIAESEVDKGTTFKVVFNKHD